MRSDQRVLHRTQTESRHNGAVTHKSWRLLLGMASCCIAICVALLAPASHAATTTSDWRSVRLDVKKIEVAGTTFAWSELGSGPPLLLLNGTASPMNEWDPAFLAGLSLTNRVIVFDYPGLGDSGPSPGPWKFNKASDWISEFAEKVSPGLPVNVLGWSMGGFIAQQMVIRHPKNVNALILAATNPGSSQAVLGPLWVQKIDSNSSSDADYLRTNYPRAGIAAGKRFLSRLTAAMNSGAYQPSDTPTKTLNAMVAAEDPWLHSNANIQALHAVTIPALVLAGAQDVITPRANSSTIASRIPGARLVVFPEGGHSFLFQLPEKVSTTVNTFLAKKPLIASLQR